MDYKEENRISVEKAKEIALELSNVIGCGSWALNETRSTEYGNGGYIVSGDRELHVKAGGYKLRGRIEISGCYNGLTSYLPYHKNRENATITVADTKTGAEIAKDIIRRLLPPYERMLAEAKKSRETDLANRSKIMGILTKLAELIPGASVRDPDDLSETAHGARPWVTTYHNPYYDVRKIETYGDDVHIDMRMSPGLAESVFSLLKASIEESKKSNPKGWDVVEA